jgi:hypothetical protein
MTERKDVLREAVMTERKHYISINKHHRMFIFLNLIFGHDRKLSFLCRWGWAFIERQRRNATGERCRRSLCHYCGFYGRDGRRACYGGRTSDTQ